MNRNLESGDPRPVDKFSVPDHPEQRAPRPYGDDAERLALSGRMPNPTHRRWPAPAGAGIEAEREERRAARRLARRTKGDRVLERDAFEHPGEDVATALAFAERAVLPAATVGQFVAGDPAVYAAAKRLAMIAARLGRHCGTRGRRADWGTERDTGGMPSRYADRDDARDEEAAIDAIGKVWARAAAGRYGAPSEPFPTGRLFTAARNAGRLAAVRRIREHAPLADVADRRVPAEDKGTTLAALIAAVPPARQRAAMLAMEEAKSAEPRSARRSRAMAKLRQIFEAGRASQVR